MFKITQGKGFFITFENGYSISVQFGGFNYCTNRTMDFVRDHRTRDIECGEKGSGTAEIAVMNPEGEFVGEELGIFKDDGVEGWCSPERVLEVMNIIAGIQADVVDPDDLHAVVNYDEENEDG